MTKREFWDIIVPLIIGQIIGTFIALWIIEKLWF